MSLKQCAKCFGSYDAEVFFRKTRGVACAHATSGTRPVCRGCEQTARDEKKAANRWPAKIHDAIRGHASRMKTTVKRLQQEFGWTFDQMLHDAQRAYENGCPYCHKAFAGMGHGLNDITLDIVNPTDPPYYITNVRWICATCNREKGRTPAVLWAAKRAAWDAWHRVRQLRLGQLTFRW